MDGIRRDYFPIIDKKPYFNTCSIGPLALPVQSAVETYMDNWNTYGGISWVMEEGWNHAIEEARSLFAKIIGAKKEDIAYSFGNSVAFSSVLSSINWKNGDNMIFSDQDFPAIPSNIMAKTSQGIEYKVVTSVEGKVLASDYAAKISENTRLVTASEVASNTGSRINAQELIEISHDKGVPVFIDSYQSTGVIPTDVKKLDVDYLASGCLKWLIGGFGMSFLYIRPDLINSTNPSSIGWMGVDDPFADLYDKLRTTLHRPSNGTKFQYGTPYPFGAVTAKEGMKIVNNIGIPRIYEHDMSITQEIIEAAQNRGYNVQTPLEREDRGSIVNIQIDHPERVVERLQKEGYILDMRSNGIRLAPHFYNNSEDISNLFSMLDQIKAEE